MTFPRRAATVLLLSLAPISAKAADIVFDAADSAQAVGPASTITISTLTVAGSDRLLFVGAGNSGNTPRTTTSVVRGSENFTEKWDIGLDFFASSGSYFVAPATGTIDITATFAGTADELILTAVSLNNVHQTSPVGVQATATGTTATATVTGTAGDDEWLVDFAYTWSTTILAEATDQVMRVEEENINGGTSGGSSTQLGSVAGDVMSWTLGGGANTWNIGALPVRDTDWAEPPAEIISFVGGATGVSVGNTDCSVSLTALTGGSASAPIDGDLVIFAYNIADGDNVDMNLVTVTAGYTEVADLLGNGTGDANLGVFYKFMGATPDTTAAGEGSLGGTDTSIQCVAMVFRDVAPVASGGPFDVASTTATGTTTGDPDPPSIDTTGAAGIWPVIVGANAHAANVNGTFTGPTSYTVDFLTVGNQDTVDGIIGMGYRTGPADPEDPGLITTATAATGWAAVTMALRPEAAGPPAVTCATLALLGAGGCRP